MAAKVKLVLTLSNPSERQVLGAWLADLSPNIQVRSLNTPSQAVQECRVSLVNAAVFSEDFIDLPEFQTHLGSLRKLSVKVLALTAPGKDREWPANDITSIRSDMDDAALCAKLGLSVPNNRSEPEPVPIAKDRIILIGASTGGVDALIAVLKAFPKNCPPTFIVQHTGGTFSEGLARLLDSKTRICVREAENGMPVGAGTAVLAPGDRCHLQIGLRKQSAICRLVDEAHAGGHRPAVDKLFKSAVPHASRVTAAILTGMGRDGAEGLWALKNAGARTFGQDEATSLVYGMPKVAAELGAVERQLPLDRIGRALIKACVERTVE